MTVPAAAAEEVQPTPPYLRGNYAPTDGERELVLTDVIGTVPRDLHGTWVRNGSNPRFRAEGRHHWFDGDGMLHALSFADGRVTYRNRWVRTKAFDAETEAGHALWRGVTEPPDFSNPRGPLKDTSNTDLVWHGGKLYTLWWLGGEVYEVAMPSLDTVGRRRFGHVRTMSAHPKVDPVTGDLRFFDYKPFPPFLTYGVVDAAGQLVHHTEVDLPGPRLQHDMAITENFSIVMDMSMMWDPEQLARGKTRVGFFRDKPTRFGVIPTRGAGDTIRWFETDACFMYHTINAWEEGDEIVLVGCRITDPLVGDPHQVSTRRAPEIGFLRLEPYLFEWRLNLTTGAVRTRQLDDVLSEFPKMDVRVLGRRSRFVYSPRIADAPTLLFDGLIRYDLHRGTSDTLAWPDGHFGGEASFAPRVGSTAEDDGYLITFVVDEASGASEAVIVDAAHVADGPVARVKIPVRVPTGYHTYWVPDLSG